MRFLHLPRRRPRTDPALHIRFVDPAGPELTMAFAAGDSAAFGGVRATRHPDRIDVTPWPPHHTNQQTPDTTDQTLRHP